MRQFIKFEGTIHEVTNQAVLDAARIKWGDGSSEMPIWHTANCAGPGDDSIATLGEDARTDEIGVEYRRMMMAAKPRGAGVNYAGF